MDSRLPYKNFIFDCDGVLLDSNNFKLDAMAASLEEYDQVLVSDFVDYFRRNFGRSRYHHVDVFFESYLRRAALHGEKEAILERYGRQCKQRYMECQICEGAIELLVQQGSAHCWVASGSDQAELRDVFDGRELSQYFSGVYGAPVSKANNICTILDKHSLERHQTCLIGDARGDYEAAREAGIGFIFCSGYSNTPELAAAYAAEGYPVVKTLQEVGGVLHL